MDNLPSRHSLFKQENNADTLMGKAWDSNIIIIVVNHVQRGNVDTLMKLMGKAWDSNIIIIVVNHVQRGNVDTLMKLMGKAWDSNNYYYCSKSCSKRKCRYSNEVDGESLGQ